MTKKQQVLKKVADSAYTCIAKQAAINKEAFFLPLLPAAAAAWGANKLFGDPDAAWYDPVGVFGTGNKAREERRAARAKEYDEEQNQLRDEQKRRKNVRTFGTEFDKKLKSYQAAINKYDREMKLAEKNGDEAAYMAAYKDKQAAVKSYNTMNAMGKERYVNRATNWIPPENTPAYRRLSEEEQEEIRQFQEIQNLKGSGIDPEAEDAENALAQMRERKAQKEKNKQQKAAPGGAYPVYGPPGYYGGQPGYGYNPRRGWGSGGGYDPGYNQGYGPDGGSTPDVWVGNSNFGDYRPQPLPRDPGQRRRQTRWENRQSANNTRWRSRGPFGDLPDGLERENTPSNRRLANNGEGTWVGDEHFS